MNTRVRRKLEMAKRVREFTRAHAVSEPGYGPSLTRLEEEFGEHFLRIHRNCLVARARIREIGKQPGADEGHFLRLEGLDERLPVSRRQYSAFRENIKSV